MRNLKDGEPAQVSPSSRRLGKYPSNKNRVAPDEGALRPLARALVDLALSLIEEEREEAA